MKTVGSRAEVWHGTAKKTSGGLLKKDLKKNKRGRIVSKKMSNRAKKEKRLEKAGYKTKKGVFKKFKAKKRGGENSNNNETNFVYDRKDQKQHGEKGDIVGNFKDGNTLIVDDVITAGTAIKSTLEKLDKYNIKTNSLLVMLDREEKGSKKISASQELKEDYGIDVYSLINISDIINYVSITGQFESYTKDIVAYKTKYGS